MPTDRPNSQIAAAEPGTTIGPFRIANVISDGASGTLYEAVEVATGRRVAVRHLPERIAREPEAAGRLLRAAGHGLAHPNVVAVERIEQVGDDAFLVSEFVGGRPAAGNASRMPWRLATRVVRDAARGLAAIHNAGLVHGQIKPAHLIVAHDGTVKLADLGLAGLDETPVNPASAAPELIRGQVADARTDLYGLGATYFALLSGRAPFAEAGNAIDVYDAILHRPLPTARTGAPDVPLRCDVILQKLMAKSPADRYATAEGLIADLDAVLAIDEPRRPAPLPLLPRPRPVWRRPAGIVGGVCLLVAVGAAGWYVFGPQPPAAETTRRPAGPPRPPAVANSIGMSLVRVPSGVFGMGDPLVPDARPPHLVKITRAFLIGATEVTQGQFREVTGANPSEFFADERCPVESVTWAEATAFCEKLSDREAERAAGRVYRLPTEAEWEYACRAGTDTPFSIGTTLPGTMANTAESGFRATMPVGMFPANPIGLFDVHGNVWEWCGDWYSGTYYATGKSIDPTGPREGTRRVARGGSWQSDPGDCRSAFRGKFTPDTRSPAIGFRVVCVTGTAP